MLTLYLILCICRRVVKSIKNSFRTSSHKSKGSAADPAVGVNTSTKAAVVEKIDTEKLDIPTGRLGIHLKGKPAIITKVDDDSPLAGKVKVGQVLHRVAVPGNGEISAGSTKLAAFLKEHSASEGRSLILGPAVGGAAGAAGAYLLSTKKGDEREDETQMEETALQNKEEETREVVEEEMTKVVVPPGVIGIDFEGKPPMITKVYRGSHAEGKMKVGQVIHGATVLGEEGLCVAETGYMQKFLKKESGAERVLLLKGEGWDVEEEDVEDDSENNTGYGCCA